MTPHMDTEEHLKNIRHSARIGTEEALAREGPANVLPWAYRALRADLTAMVRHIGTFEESGRIGSAPVLSDAARRISDCNRKLSVLQGLAPLAAKGKVVDLDVAVDSAAYVAAELHCLRHRFGHPPEELYRSESRG